MNSGIYKITNPNGRVYIGQSSDFKKRFEIYKALNCKNQRRLYNSFIKYGFEQHQIEIIEYCEFDNLNNKERYWQEHYDCLSSDGLNCLMVNTNEKKAKFSDETLFQMCVSRRKRVFSNETKLKMSLSKKGIPKSPEHVEKVRIALTGRKLRPEQIEYLRNIHIGRKQQYDEVSKKFKRVVCLKSGKIYESAKAAALAAKISYSCFTNKLNGVTKVNDTGYEYLDGKTKRGERVTGPEGLRILTR